ncbi:4-hydroxybenzoate octaprenyltransferase [Methylocystis parvus]|uniref:4-hydroxybenzoate octaprenyltransferase n=1 Tax=Methylocystis parvus TaxID=134 RepID=A0A6B8MC06_9HYPH|nr:4-hydroxybenzoate octaprenyltransferase [Methylocystis parvus]QGM98200.1 4-hydroxybenzoate octaprenyltransferase [Methylocystis parvus]WBK01473.1 4-hydroxybenzoate octaprenyltransferase [Methylocystis parvus OBBP]
MSLTQESGDADAALPDSQKDHPLWRHAPASLRPYVQLARLDRPVGWWLLLLPCWESSAMASAALRQGPNFWHLTLFFIGAVVMRGAGSTYNDYVDREIDAKVERTRNRPLASGRVSPRAALWFIVVQCLVGLFVLLSFNGYTIALSFLSLLIVAVYPFAKRFTSWPQAILGFAFAYGALLGWTAIAGALAAPALLLYASCILWTIGFDTIYALQDVRDDAIAGVRSTARLFGAQVKRAVGGLYAGSVLCAALAAHMIGGGLFSYLGVAAYAAHLAWQISLTREDAAPGAALMLFRSNRDAGLLLFAGFFTQSLLNLL